MFDLTDTHDSATADHSNASVACSRVRALPEFVSRRLLAYQERKRANWGGRHIMQGRTATAEDLVFTSNDYLALAQHPAIVEAEVQALRTHGKGAMMSAIFLQDGGGTQRALEQRMADDLGADCGVLAQSGWCGNVGLIQSIADERTPVYVDHLGHASLWEGVKSAGAKGIPVHHNDTDHLLRQVLRYGPGVIAVDAVYSTTGALCPIADYLAIAEAHDCVLLVDESHSLGTHGPNGEGLVAALGLSRRVDFVTASLAKAYVGRAGLITCREPFTEFFASESMPAIFSSTLLPHDLAGIRAAHEVIRDETWRRTRLHAISAHVRNELLEGGFPLGNGSEQILGMEVGIEADTMVVRDALEASGIIGSIFCAPATPAKRALIRLSLNAGLADTEVERLVKTLLRIRSRIRLDEWSSTRRLVRSTRTPGLRELAA